MPFSVLAPAEGSEPGQRVDGGSACGFARTVQPEEVDAVGEVAAIRGDDPRPGRGSISGGAGDAGGVFGVQQSPVVDLDQVSVQADAVAALLDDASCVVGGGVQRLTDLS